MNIKQHIEAGHYPKDEHGMELVKTSTGLTIRIADVHPDDGRIAGWAEDAGGPAYTWNAEGGAFLMHIGSLLPPPPRKVEVKAVARIHVDGTLAYCDHDNPDHRAEVSKNIMNYGGRMVLLTGSYEEEWK